ncbi:ABC transporter ATP-binding protein [Acetivibrio cellulolyticus]|uniref:ABC transporter ATP-binding protein n=1 Tax=Acetivibrio cellulolyticus TaxID=35830 RepID=UPI0001E2F12E|nr:ABC transporter ATP-binding protein [Acetivibrio cellulolyticus]
MKRLFALIRKQWLPYFIGIMALLTSIILDMFNPYFVGKIIDRTVLNKDMDYLKTALIFLAGITIGRAILGYTKEYGFDLAGSKVILNLRKNLFDHIQKMSFSFFDENNTGELMSRIKEDAENIMNAICFGIMLFMEQCVYFIIASVVLFTINWKLALISLIVMPVIEIVVFNLERKVGKTYEQISDQRAVLNSTAQQNISGVRVVKAFGREKHEIQKFLNQNEENYKINLEQVKIFAKHNPAIEFLANLVLVLVISFGGYFVIKGEMTLGTLVAFSNYIYMLIWPMRMMGWLTNIIAQCIASVKKIDKIFNEVPSIKNCDNPKVPEEIKGHILFENVSFDFAGTTVLKDINIVAEPGKTIAIMGITGAGKSSLVNLIGRYYDCTSGKVCFDGIDVKEMDLSVLRKNISVVMQETFLFSDTIDENIRFGADGISDEDYKSACRDSMVDEFVSQMPKGYDTIIGERGIGLSGGQKQRISIARALVRNPKVLIMDDSTSALDMETEYAIEKAMEQRKGITKFIIAHRVSAVKNADEILYFENGRIVERGNHKELMNQRGRYYETYCEQYRDYVEVLEEEVI